MIEHNNIPKNWRIVELKDVVSILGDGLHGTPKYSDSGDYFFINGNNLCDGRIIIKNNTKRVTKEEYEKYKKPLNENTILVSINGTLGNIAYYRNEKVILGKSACYFNVLETIDKKYLSILLSGLHFFNYANNSATGSTIKNVSLKAMREFNVPLPPLPEQQAIVSKIEELLSELENGKQQLQIAQQQLKVYRQSLLKWAFEGKLTNKDVKEGELPKRWKWVKLGQSTVNFDGKRIPLSREVRSKRKGEYRYYGATEIVDYIDNYIFDGIFLLIGEDGANLVTKSRPLAFIAEGKFWVNNHAHVLQTKSNVNLKFLCHYFNSLNLSQFVTGSAQPKLTQANLNKILVPLPPLEEQRHIVDELESKLTVCDKIEETISQSLKQAETLRQSILKKAFEGKLI